MTLLHDIFWSLVYLFGIAVIISGVIGAIKEKRGKK